MFLFLFLGTVLSEEECSNNFYYTNDNCTVNSKIENSCFINIQTSDSNKIDAPVLIDCGSIMTISHCLFCNNIGHNCGAIQANNANVEFTCMYKCSASQIGNYDVESFVLNLYPEVGMISTVQSSTICFCELNDQTLNNYAKSTAIKNIREVHYSGMNISQNDGNNIYCLQGGGECDFSYSSFIENNGDNFILTYSDDNSKTMKISECNFINNELTNSSQKRETAVVRMTENGNSNLVNCYFAGTSTYFYSTSQDIGSGLISGCYFEDISKFDVSEQVKSKPGVTTNDPIERETKNLFATNLCFGTPPRTYPEEGCPGLETPQTRTLRIKVLHTLSALSIVDSI